jgi:hypothetical protein
MADPAMISIPVWIKTIAGAVVGSATSLVVMPAKSHRDACLRFACTFGFDCCLTPISTRILVAKFNASVDWIPDITLATAAVEGLICWTLIAAVVKIAEQYSQRVAEEGLVAFFTRKKM